MTNVKLEDELPAPNFVIYQLAADLLYAGDPRPTLSTLARLVRDWDARPAHDFPLDVPIFRGGSPGLEWRVLSTSTPLTWWFRRRESLKLRGRIVSTDVAAWARQGGLRLGISLRAHDQGRRYAPWRGRPRLVGTLIDKMAVKLTRRLSGRARETCSVSAMDDFVELLECPRRLLPVVVQFESRKGGMVLDPQHLAQRLAGLAYVCTVRRRELGDFECAMGDEWTYARGGIRTFYPGWEDGHSPGTKASKIRSCRHRNLTGPPAFLNFLTEVLALRLARQKFDWDGCPFLSQPES